MDAFYFLKSRTQFIRFFYAEGAKGFADVKHRIENATDQLLTIVEVQCGDYLGEDDIVRFSDDFGRA